MAGTAHFLQGMIESRLSQEELYGDDHPERPVCEVTRILRSILTLYQNDLLSWMLDAAPANRKTPRQIMNRMLFFQLGAIHTSSEVCTTAILFFLHYSNFQQTLTHVLLHLAASSEYIATLREEIKIVTSLKGWTKEAMDEMHQMDSFIRESQRFNGLTTGLSYIMHTLTWHLELT